MKKEHWFEDQPVLRSDLARAQDTKEDAIRERITDSRTAGVVRNTQLAGESQPFAISQGPSAGLFVTVGTGIAYAPSGERILISSVTGYNSAAPTSTTDNGIGGATLTPRSTGSQNIPLTGASTNHVYLGYLSVTDPSVFTLKQFTNERLFVKSDDGYEIVVNTSGSNPDSSRFIKIGEVVTAGGAVTAIRTSNVTTSDNYLDTVPTSPSQLIVTLPNIPNSIPSITRDPGGAADVLTFTNSTPGTGQFTVNFSAGVITFASDSDGEDVDVAYTYRSIRREFSSPIEVASQVPVVDKPTEYAAGLNVTFKDHISARGGATITPSNPHGITAADIGLADVENIGQQLSTSGIILPTGSASSVVSALSPSAVSSPILLDNKVTIQPLTGSEALNIEGVLIQSSDINSITEFDFEDPDTPGTGISAGTYTFYVDSVTKTVERTTAGGSVPSTGFAIAAITWNGTQLLTPLTDLRLFGTTSAPNIRFEVLGALSIGLATGGRLSDYYYGRLIGTVAATGGDPGFPVGGLDIDVTVDGTPGTITFPGAAASTVTIGGTGGIVDTIDGSVGSIKTLVNVDKTITLIARETLEITGGTALAALGLSIDVDDNGDLKVLLIDGDTATTGVSGAEIPVRVDMTYDATPERKLTNVDSRVGNKNLSTTITYNADGSINNVEEDIN